MNFQIGKIFGLQISAVPLVFVEITVIWCSLSLIGYFVFDIPLGESILLGWIGTVLHFVTELIHCLGHAVAAKSTGYPMIGIRFGVMAIFAMTIYPNDEPELPSSIHIRRALGGPIANLITSIILFATLPLWHGNWYWLGLFIFLNNFFFHTLQVFLPLGFNDGTTILNQLLKRKSNIVQKVKS